VFIGYVLEADRLADSTSRTVTTVVRFVTEESWRGPLPDTVTLFVDADAPCSQYFTGYRYLVGADWDARVPTRLTTATCDFSWGVSTGARSRNVRLREEVGPPNWTAPPAGARELDEGARPFGTPIPRSPGATRVAFIPPRNTFTSNFEIGDFRGVSYPSGGPILYPEPGLYQVRVTWKDGSQFQGYVSVRCELDQGDGGCLVVRDFSALLLGR